MRLVGGAAFTAAGDAAPFVAALVAVAFEVDFFEVERVVVEAGGVPVEAGDGPAAAVGLCRIDFGPARGGEIGRQFAGWCGDADSELVEWLVFDGAARIFGRRGGGVPGGAGKTCTSPPVGGEGGVGIFVW